MELLTFCCLKHCLDSDIISRATAFSQLILPPSAHPNVPRFYWDRLYINRLLCYVISFITEVCFLLDCFADYLLTWHCLLLQFVFCGIVYIFVITVISYWHEEMATCYNTLLFCIMKPCESVCACCILLHGRAEYVRCYEFQSLCRLLQKFFTAYADVRRIVFFSRKCTLCGPCKYVKRLIYVFVSLPFYLLLSFRCMSVFRLWYSSYGLEYVLLF